MRHSRLHVITIAFVLCSTAAAQHTVLVEHDDRNEPCRRFKMRILVPDGHTDDKLPVKKLANDIDPGIVWNPCLIEEPQLAFAPTIPPPDKKGGFFGPSPFRLRPPFEWGRGRKPLGPLRPESPSAFEFMWRRRP